MKKNEKGFGAVEALLILVIVGLIGFVGWYVWHNRAAKIAPASPATAVAKTTTPTTQSTKPTDPYANWKTYCDSFKIGCIKYPTDWMVTEHLEGEGPNIQITSPGSTSNPTDISFTLQTKGPATSKNDKVVKTYQLSSPISGLSIISTVINGAHAPNIVLVDKDLNWNHTKDKYTWYLSAAPTNLPFKTDDQANQWLTSQTTATALKVIQSFTYQ